MSIRWNPEPLSGHMGWAVDGYDPQGRVAVRVVRFTQGYQGFLRGDPVGGVHPEPGGAKRECEEAWALAPEPPRRGRVVGDWAGVPPHPGTVPARRRKR